ncbi:MAG: hypothetical protein WD066_10140 [Planctomycetaceae bacterium]
MGVPGRCAIAIAGAAIYAVSFALPAFVVMHGGSPESGLEAFLAGARMWYIVLMDGPVALIRGEVDFPDLGVCVILASWVANPAIVVAIGMAAFGRWRFAAAACAIGLCLLFAPLFSLSSGYWVWLGSAVFLWGASVFAMLCERRRRR